MISSSIININISICIDPTIASGDTSQIERSLVISSGSSFAAKTNDYEMSSLRQVYRCGNSKALIFV